MRDVLAVELEVALFTRLHGRVAHLVARRRVVKGRDDLPRTIRARGDRVRVVVAALELDANHIGVRRDVRLGSYGSVAARQRNSGRHSQGAPLRRPRTVSGTGSSSGAVRKQSGRVYWLGYPVASRATGGASALAS